MGLESRYIEYAVKQDAVRNLIVYCTVWNNTGRRRGTLVLVTVQLKGGNAYTSQLDIPSV